MSVNALLKPRSIEVETAEGNPYSATVTMEPFETGYAHTLGNALRRVLLSSMVGFAPTEAQIAGVVHEYSQIDGVKEDVVDILLNVKGIIFKLENRDEVTITLRKEGEGIVTAADFDLPHDVQILNPEHVIANLSGGKLDMQLKIEKGRGYQPGDMRALKDDYSKGTIGRIIMDASFSPILRVAYRVENARVEQRTDLDKLVMNIETAPSFRKKRFVKPPIFFRISSPSSADCPPSVSNPLLRSLLSAHCSRRPLSKLRWPNLSLRLIRSFVVRSTTLNLPFVPPTASRPKIFTISAT